jgi:hypothetical protein
MLRYRMREWGDLGYFIMRVSAGRCEMLLGNAEPSYAKNGKDLEYAYYVSDVI